ncbi:MAG: hypothetical protein JO023_23990 [Chloroflexi bacterium]|nr:hypothetical protein [Chloroflexota bacterium]
MAGSARQLLLSRPADVEDTARAIAAGAVVGHAFGNFYVISTRPDAAVVRSVNVMKGRPADQVGSLTTIRAHIPDLFDWSALPDGLSRSTVTALIDRLFDLGPFGFRGPANRLIPDHLAADDGGTRTTQVIAPGYGCRSNALLARALELLGSQYLYITSANRSRHQTGAEDEPAHFTAAGLRAEFGHEPDFLVLEHDDEAAARARYPWHAPMSTTILAFHKLGGLDQQGRTRLIVERHGSLPIELLRPIVAEFGFGLELGPKARQRLQLRVYGQPAEVA